MYMEGGGRVRNVCCVRINRLSPHGLVVCVLA